MRTRFAIWTAVLAGGFLLGWVTPVKAGLPLDDLRSPAAFGSRLDTGDLMTKPYGWLQFGEVCAFNRRFTLTLDRLKRSRGRVIVRNFRDLDGDLYDEALPSMLGLDCVPYSVGFD